MLQLARCVRRIESGQRDYVATQWSSSRSSSILKAFELNLTRTAILTRYARPRARQSRYTLALFVYFLYKFFTVCTDSLSSTPQSSKEHIPCAHWACTSVFVVFFCHLVLSSDNGTLYGRLEQACYVGFVTSLLLPLPGLPVQPWVWSMGVALNFLRKGMQLILDSTVGLLKLGKIRLSLCSLLCCKTAWLHHTTVVCQSASTCHTSSPTQNVHE